MTLHAIEVAARSSELVPPLVCAPFASEAELLAAARRLAGFTIAELSHALGIDCGTAGEAQRNKGFIGRVVERALGLFEAVRAPLMAADPVARQLPSAVDFGALGIELKTLPVGPSQRPRESTFVCHVPLSQLVDTAWEDSRVALKLARVLFLPIESGERLSLAQRRIGRAFIWSPSAAHTHVLRADYLEIARRVAEGHLETLDARVGQAMQLRPKAAHSGIRVRVTDGDGSPLLTGPRAFYLRASFTARLLQESLAGDRI
jgi:DNA mismatch repair protein MutH